MSKNRQSARLLWVALLVAFLLFAGCVSKASPKAEPTESSNRRSSRDGGSPGGGAPRPNQAPADTRSDDYNTSIIAQFELRTESAPGLGDATDHEIDLGGNYSQVRVSFDFQTNGLQPINSGIGSANGQPPPPSAQGTWVENSTNFVSREMSSNTIRIGNNGYTSQGVAVAIITVTDQAEKARFATGGWGDVKIQVTIEAIHGLAETGAGDEE